MVAPAATADVGEVAIEDRAIDDRGAHALGVDDDRGAVGETKRAASAAPTIARRERLELVERVEAEDARAMHGRADDVVFLEHADAEAGGSELARSDESGRAAADDTTHNRTCSMPRSVSTCGLWTPMCHGS